MRVENSVIRVVPLLGKTQRTCPRGWTWNSAGNFCEQTSGGGSARILRMPPMLFGASGINPTGAAVAAAANETTTTPLDPTAPTSKDFSAGGFDFMQFLSDNALWFGLGVAGVIAIMLLSKPKRR